MRIFVTKETLFFWLIFLLSLFLNFYQFDKNPPGLYVDEVAIGVNAYSILTIGRDEYGIKFPIYFRSYDDYKLPVYIYLTSASMAIFGKSEFAVRLPSAFFGSLTIIAFYLFIRNLSSSRRYALLTCFLLAACPWFMQFVGPAFEATVALSLFTFGCYFFLIYSRTKKLTFYVVGLFLFFLTVYTYHGYKVIVPIIFFLIFLHLLGKGIKNKKWKTEAFFLGFFFIPILLSFSSSAFETRFSQTSAFSTISINNVIIFLKNYLSYFSTDFLFSFGDGINRHQFLNFGILPRWTLPFLVIGLFSLLAQKRSLFKYVAFGLLLGTRIPASMALPSPHTLRSLTMVLPYVMFIAVGMITLLSRFKTQTNIFALLITIFFVYEFSLYLHYGFFHYPKTALIDWGGNYKEVVEQVTTLSVKYPNIAIDEKLTKGYEYFRFYNDSLKPIAIKPGWDKKPVYGNNPVLLITPDLTGMEPPSPKLVGTVYLPDVNKTIFAQLWEL